MSHSRACCSMRRALTSLRKLMLCSPQPVSPAAVSTRTMQCRVVELRFFAGLTIDEVGDAIGVSAATVEREWAMAKAWLYQRLSVQT